MFLARCAIGAVLVCVAAPASAQEPSSPRLTAAQPSRAPPQDPIAVRVVYPGPEDRVRVRDSSFLLGSVSDGEVRLTINGSRVRVWPNGAWLAWLPFPPDSVMQFRIEAHRQADSTVLIYPVRRDPRYYPGEVHSGGAWIDTMSLTPRGQVWLPPSEYVTLSARVADGAEVRVHLPDGSTVPLQPQLQPEEVLPAIRAFERDTAKLLTPDEVRYVGLVRGRTLGPHAGPMVRGPSPSLVQALARSALRCVTGAQCPSPYMELLPPDAGWAVIEARLGTDTVRARWPRFVVPKRQQRSLFGRLKAPFLRQKLVRPKPPFQ